MQMQPAGPVGQGGIHIHGHPDEHNFLCHLFAYTFGKVESIVEDVKKKAMDFTGGVRVEMPEFISKCYLWSAVCLTAHSFGSWIGMIVFYFLQSVSGSGSTIMAIFWPSALAWLCMEYFATASGDAERMVLIASTFLGFLHGRLIRNAHMTMFAPLVPIIPLCMASYARIFGSFAFVRNDRRIFVGTTLFTAACLCATGGLTQGYPSYFLYLAVLMLAAFVDLQLKIGKSNKGSLGSMPLEQWKTVIILATADLIAFWTLSDGKQTARARYDRQAMLSTPDQQALSMEPPGVGNGQ